MIEFTYGEGAGKIILEKGWKGLYRFKLRIPAEGFAHESLTIKICGSELGQFKELMKSRGVGKFKLGKHQGINKEYLLIERTEKNDRFKIELNSWFLIFGASLGNRIGREDADELGNLIEKHF